MITGIDKAELSQRGTELIDLLRAVCPGVVDIRHQLRNGNKLHFGRCFHQTSPHSAKLLKAAKVGDVFSSNLDNFLIRSAIHGIVPNGAAERYGLAGFLGFEESVDVDGHIRLGQILAVQTTACYRVGHIRAELAVVGTGVHIGFTCPAAERVDLSTGIQPSERIRRCIALAEDEPVAVQNVLPS